MSERSKLETAKEASELFMLWTMFVGLIYLMVRRPLD